MSFRTPLFLAAVALAGLMSCERHDPGLVQGYVEGEFVYVASPFGGQLDRLSVERGATVQAGAPLFALDATSERATREEAARRVAQARASLEDAKLGQRPTELESIKAQLNEARAASGLSQQELDRVARLRKTGVVAQRDVDVAQSQWNQDRQRVSQLTANLATAELGSRDQQIAAAAENLKAQESALARADWNLAQKSQRAPVAGRVDDTLYRPGDWVAAGQPAVILLPPGNVKIRIFVSQNVFGRIQPGDSATVHVDGVSTPFAARVTFLSPRAEYTPPVIYSQQMREKFAFLIELSCTPDVATKLHPGQPVDVQLKLH